MTALGEKEDYGKDYTPEKEVEVLLARDAYSFVAACSYSYTCARGGGMLARENWAMGASKLGVLRNCVLLCFNRMFDLRRFRLLIKSCACLRLAVHRSLVMCRIRLETIGALSSPAMQSPPQLAVAAPAPRIRTGHRRVAVLLLGVATVAYPGGLLAKKLRIRKKQLEKRLRALRRSLK